MKSHTIKQHPHHNYKYGPSYWIACTNLEEEIRKHWVFYRNNISRAYTMRKRKEGIISERPYDGQELYDSLRDYCKDYGPREPERTDRINNAELRYLIKEKKPIHDLGRMHTVEFPDWYKAELEQYRKMHETLAIHNTNY